MIVDSAQKRASDSRSFTDKETAKADGEANALKLKDETKAKLAENMNTMETLFSKLSEESSAEPVALQLQEPQRFLRHRRVHLRGPELLRRYHRPLPAIPRAVRQEEVSASAPSGVFATCQPASGSERRHCIMH